MKINWGVRFKNKVWVSGFVSQTLLLIQAFILGLEGLNVIDIDLETLDAWSKWVIGIINLVLAYLSYLGIITDPTVEGIEDSTRVMSRDEPIKNKLQ
ncbi:phage holin [Peribacillus frigoritolerans]|uniref:phage holin n=1 Tax=Peribacillus frigoritolerans TaxID=450367 RepID=UPI0021D0A33C|nr:phage holin [Peribacillus frigoritolerans]MCU6603837.1 phage holin [Peribacillus frigoritolerans]